MNNKFRKILLCVSILIFATSILYIVYNKYTLYSEEQLNEQIKEEKESSSLSQEETNIPEKNNEEKDSEEIYILPQYQKLYEENSDIIAWISISGSVVDYPVMFTPEDPNYYLYKNWNKEESKSGSIFIDGRSTENTENIIIYGHKMRNGSMFGSLEKFKNEEYYQQHK